MRQASATRARSHRIPKKIEDESFYDTRLLLEMRSSFPKVQARTRLTHSVIILDNVFDMSLSTPRGRQDVKVSLCRPLRTGKYKHFKGGIYFVLGQARHSETLEPMVVYRSTTRRAAGGRPKMWVRPQRIFDGWVKRDGQNMKRFRYMPPSVRAERYGVGRDTRRRSER